MTEIRHDFWMMVMIRPQSCLKRDRNRLWSVKETYAMPRVDVEKRGKPRCFAVFIPQTCGKPRGQCGFSTGGAMYMQFCAPFGVSAAGDLFQILRNSAGCLFDSAIYAILYKEFLCNSRRREVRSWNGETIWDLTLARRAGGRCWVRSTAGEWNCAKSIGLTMNL